MRRHTPRDGGDRAAALGVDGLELPLAVQLLAASEEDSPLGTPQLVIRGCRDLRGRSESAGCESRQRGQEGGGRGGGVISWRRNVHLGLPILFGGFDIRVTRKMSAILNAASCRPPCEHAAHPFRGHPDGLSPRADPFSSIFEAGGLKPVEAHVDAQDEPLRLVPPLAHQLGRDPSHAPPSRQHSVPPSLARSLDQGRNSLSCWLPALGRRTEVRGVREEIARSQLTTSADRVTDRDAVLPVIVVLTGDKNDSVRLLQS